MRLADKYENYIFDLDGTLIDSMNVWYEVDKRFLSERGLDFTREYIDKVKSSAMLDSAVFTVEHYKLNETPEQVMACWNAMVYDAYRKEIKLKSGAREFLMYLTELKTKNPDIRLAVATALSYQNASAALESNGIKEVFDVVLTLEDLPGGIDKSQPDIYYEVLKRMGKSNERTEIGKSIIFEDVYIATQGAMRGGFDVCSVYDPVGSGSEWDKMKRTTHYAVESWSEINTCG